MKKHERKPAHPKDTIEEKMKISDSVSDEREHEELVKKPKNLVFSIGILILTTLVGLLWRGAIGAIIGFLVGLAGIFFVKSWLEKVITKNSRKY